MYIIKNTILYNLFVFFFAPVFVQFNAPIYFCIPCLPTFVFLSVPHRLFISFLVFCWLHHHHHSSTCVERTDLTTPLQVPRSCIAIPSSFLAMWESLASTSGYDNLLLLLPFGLGFHSTKEETTSFVAR